MSVYRYPVTTLFIPNLPKIPYRNGKSEGVVIHYTDEQRDSALAEHKFEMNHWQDAFVHEFIDANTCLVQADKNYACWGCGPHGNQRYYQIEMCDAANQKEFDAIFDRTAQRTAQMLFEDGLVPVDNVTVRSHCQISKEFPQDTNHTDPDAFLAKWGSSWAALVQKVSQYYQAMVDESKPKPAPAPQTQSAVDWKVSNIAKAEENGFLKAGHSPIEPIDMGTLAAVINNLYVKLGGK